MKNLESIEEFRTMVAEEVLATEDRLKQFSDRDRATRALLRAAPMAMLSMAVLAKASAPNQETCAETSQVMTSELKRAAIVTPTEGVAHKLVQSVSGRESKAPLGIVIGAAYDAARGEKPADIAKTATEDSVPYAIGTAAEAAAGAAARAAGMALGAGTRALIGSIGILFDGTEAGRGSDIMPPALEVAGPPEAAGPPAPEMEVKPPESGGTPPAPAGPPAPEMEVKPPESAAPPSAPEAQPESSAPIASEPPESVPDAVVDLPQAELSVPQEPEPAPRESNRLEHDHDPNIRHYEGNPTEPGSMPGKGVSSAPAEVQDPPQKEAHERATPEPKAEKEPPAPREVIERYHHSKFD